MSFLSWISLEIPRQVREKLSLVDQDGVNKMGFRAQISVSCYNILNVC
jgi:hypothetical protein